MDHASVSLSSVFAVIGVILSVGAGIYGVVLRFAFNTYEKATEKRFSDLEKEAEADEQELKKEVKAITDKTHELEKKNIGLEGQIKLLESNQTRATTDIKAIRDEMVTKNEWEPRMASVEKLLGTILHEVQRGPGRYSVSNPSGSMAAARYTPARTDSPPKGPSR